MYNSCIRDPKNFIAFYTLKILNSTLKKIFVFFQLLLFSFSAIWGPYACFVKRKYQLNKYMEGIKLEGLFHSEYN